jgi:hypothetical protein
MKMFGCAWPEPVDIRRTSVKKVLALALKTVFIERL